MNKIAKILSAVISVTVALSIAIVMLTSAIAAAAPTLSMNLASETDETVVVEVKLDAGSFNGIDFGISFDDAKIVKCSNIGINLEIALASGVQAKNEVTGLYSAATTEPYDSVGDVLVTYTFEKVAGANVSKEDFTLTVSNCVNADGDKVTATVVNNIPVYEAPTTTAAPETTTAAPETTTAAPETTTAAPETTTAAPETTTAAPETTTAAPETTTAAPETTTAAPETTTAAPETTTVAPETTTEEPSTEAPTEAPTQQPVDGDVVNPDTGDSVTATAAIFSLLAVSGAAIVALRKKED